jgi:hypothetical protein
MLKDGELTAEQARVPESLEERTIDGLCPGDVMRVDADLLWYDEDGKLWLHGECPLEDAENLGGAAENFIDIIRFEEGFVVDLMTPYLPPTTLNPESIVELVNDDEIDMDRMLPVIALIATQADELTISEIYQERYGRTIEQRLNGTTGKGKRKRVGKPAVVKVTDETTATSPEQE